MLRISRLRVPKWSGNIVKYAKLQRMNISPNWSRALSSAGDSSSSSSGSVNSSSSGSGSPGDSLQTTISATDLSSNPTSDAALSSSNDFINVAEELVTTVPDLGWSPKDLAMQYIDWSHIFLDIPYWQAIIAATALLRVVILPISIKSQINAARMATLRPEMEKLNEIVKKDPLFASGDMATKARYQAEFQAMFKRHQVNPIRSMILPFIQLPLFVSFFLALRDMGNLYPGFETGGDFWFSNLALPDPMWILPAYNSLSFLFMVEMGR
jgi:YidC/Oxa1 family membrane protein insertase